MRGLNFNCNTSITEQDLIELTAGRLVDCGKFFFIPGFLKFQYPSGLSSEKPLIISVRNELESNNLIGIIKERLNNDYPIIKVRERVKEKETGKGKRKLETRDRGAGEREESVTRVLENFVSITGRKIDINIESNRRPVRARLKEGFTEPDLMDIGAYMKCLWEDSPNMKQHIQIDTIYGTKCDKYRSMMNEAKEKGLTAIQIKGASKGFQDPRVHKPNLLNEALDALKRQTA